MRWLLCVAFVWSADQAGAGCFTADDLPAKAVYDGGSVLEYLGREGDVLTYRVGQVTTQMKDGLWPLQHQSDSFQAEYRWDTLLPDLARVIADGGKAQATGRRKQGSGAWVPVVAAVEVLGQSTLDWEDCRYSVVEFRKTMLADGVKESEGVLLYAPDAMIAFRTDQVEVGTGKVSSFALKELQ